MVRRTLALIVIALLAGCVRKPALRLDMMPLMPQLVFNVAEAAEACQARYELACTANRIGGCKCASYVVPYGVWIVGK